jgi:hypothetical protein
MPNVQSLLAGARAFAESFIPFLLTAFAVVAGLWIIYSAIRQIYKKGSERMSGGRDVEWSGIAIKLLVGGLMLRLSGTVTDISIMLTGAGVQDVRGVLAYAPVTESAGLWGGVFEVCLLWVVMLGWAGAARGLFLWNKAADGGGASDGGDYFWRGFWHLIGGAAAVNLSGMIKAFLAG